MDQKERVGKRNNVFYQAQSILSRRDHSEAEVRLKLKCKGFGNEQIEEAVRWLYNNKLLDDEAYVRRYVESVIASKPVGRRWIVAKLRQRGISADMARQAVEKLISDKQELELLEQAADSWGRSHPSTSLRTSTRYKDDPSTELRVDPQRLHRFLLSRGFSFETVSSFIDSLP